MRHMLMTVLAAAAVMAGCGALAADHEDIWASRPTRAELFAALPAAAQAAGGRVVLRCKPRPTGEVTDCALVHETPVAVGAGQAVLSLTSLYRMKPDAVAKAAPRGEVVIVESYFRADKFPGWRRRPTPEEIRAVWPTEAWRRGIDGRAAVNCLTSTTGSLYACVVVSESPPDLGFGAAAIALTPQLVMAPGMLNGEPVVSIITVPFNFTGAPGPGMALTGRPIIRPAMSWTEAPSVSDVAKAYPAAALAAKQAGFVSLACSLKKDGRLRGCDVVREEPRGRGFATAAQSLASRFRLDPADFAGKSLTGASVDLPIVFDPAALDSSSGGKPLWTHMPDAVALTAAFASAKPVEAAGRAMLDCRVRQGGALEACTVASETPAGSGFGKTALALQESFRLATWTDEGLPVVGRTVHVPMRFDAPPQPSAPPAAKP